MVLKKIEKRGFDMYSVEQLQACDFLLKRIIAERQFVNLFQKNLKLVIEINGSYWFGDFIDFDGRRVTRHSFDDQGDTLSTKYSTTGSDTTPLLKTIWEAYANFAKPPAADPFWNNPLYWMESLPLLFETLVTILNQVNTDELKSPLLPYLLNAKSLDKRLELPFINLSGQKVNLVSIVEDRQ
ncbi:hypothetical protein D3C75_545890 [compost metagenome]